MGCSSSSSSGTGHSIEEVKTQEQFSNQKNGVNNNPTEAVDRSQSVQASPVNTTNNDQTISHKQTTGNDKEKPSVKSDDFKLDYNEFKHIDEYARQAPRSAEESIETLAKYLAQPAKNDIEVVRALYVWAKTFIVTYYHIWVILSLPYEINIDALLELEQSYTRSSLERM
ncbi:unnamed protein product [Mytilus edulis]|uniref:Uncharacterized protein n=1 Tax=Mytilus edulis TaxID=6550 RepID=A0A8S3T9S6_MYTED|nr:unnamed protein product [Mytilus edulis]